MIVIADDLTGANDTAIQYRKCGVASVVSVAVSENGSEFDGFDVISVNTDSRAMKMQEAYDTVFKACKYFCKKDARVYKKVDSVLRGNPGAELDAVMDALDSDVAFVCPAYPGNGRVMENGIISAAENRIDAVKTFAQDMKRKVFLVPLEKVHEGSDAIIRHIDERVKVGEKVFVIDATCDEELESVYKAVSSFKGKSVLCGSAGLAQFDAKALAKNISHKKDNSFSIEGEGVTLLMTGSRNKETRAQIQKVSSDFNVPCVILEKHLIAEGKQQEAIDSCISKIDEQIKKGEKLVVVAISSLFEEFHMVQKDSEENYKIALELAQCLARFAVAAYDKYKLNAIISCGGDTTLQLCNSLGVYGIEPIEEVAAGIPFGIFIGGKADKLPVITKSGGFGGENVLVECVNFLNKKRS